MEFRWHRCCWYTHVSPDLQANIQLGLKSLKVSVLEDFCQGIIGFGQTGDNLLGLLVEHYPCRGGVARGKQTQQDKLLVGINHERGGDVRGWRGKDKLEKEDCAGPLMQTNVDVGPKQIVFLYVGGLDVGRQPRGFGDVGGTCLVGATELAVVDVFDGLSREGVDVLVQNGEGLSWQAGAEAETHKKKMGRGEGATGGIES